MSARPSHFDEREITRMSTSCRSSKVQSWGLVGEQLLQSSRSDNNPKGASSDAATTAVPGVRRDVPYVIVAQQIREFFAKTRLELVEERLAATGKDVLSALAEQGRASWLGSWIGAASEVTGDKMVVMEPQGICHDIGEGKMGLPICKAQQPL